MIVFSRNSFARAWRAALVVYLLTGLGTEGAGAQGSDAPIELWLLTANPDGPIVRGARMGAEEMGRTASLLGRQFVLREVQTSTPGKARDAVDVLRRTARTIFVVLDVDGPEACDIARDLARARAAVVFNARVTDAPCAAPWLRLRLPADRRARALSEHGRGVRLLVDEWHASLQRFGAVELNQRYERRTHEAMDGDAWAGWFAAKAATEAALRLDRPDRAGLIGPTAPSFDGHKGAPLRFDSSGVLRQPLYIIEAGDTRSRVIREVP
jgi:hypothetical protein